MHMQAPILELSKVTKIYRNDFTRAKTVSIDSLSFVLEKPGIFGFAGPNGAGKTTTIKAIMGLISPSAGTVRINGMLAESPASRNRVAFVSEQPYFYDYLTARESLAFAGQLKGMAGQALNESIAAVADKLGLTGYLSRKVRVLSKGNQQRLNFAQALLGDPDLFILDEPMSGLDPIGRHLFRGMFRELASAGKTVFFSTHILEDIESLCERIIVLARGKKQYDGTVRELIDSGTEGTEFSVPAIYGPLREGIAANGCVVDDPIPGVSTVFVPRGKNVAAIQATLAAAGVFATAIAARNKSLEELVYNRFTNPGAP
jgi:ABC-2 type transport system ATP-binding protein